jgi:ribA/ribD-fused uncharacterized protein
MIEKFEGRWRFLSNFHPCEIEYQGIKYPSVEHYYVAMKCNSSQHFNGSQYTVGDFREIIAKTISAAIVKKMGQQIKVRSDWDEKKLDFMNWAVREKFKQEDLKELLLSTEDMPIIEGNFWHDNFYGQCSCDKCKGNGKNHLGKILMKVRDEIKGVKRPDSLGDFLKQSGNN